MNKQELTEEQMKAAIEHRDMLLDLRSVLASEPGKRVFKYLFKHLLVGDVPELGLEGPILHDRLGSLRTGNAIFKIVAEADWQIAANLLAQKEKEAYADLYQESQIQQG